MTPRAVLVGLPGTGKTTSGRRLADRLRVPFADSDDLIEQRAGRSVRAIFDQDGEEAFRAAEIEVISAALTAFDGVLALGGGAILAEPTRTALAISGVPVVLLTADQTTLAARVGRAQDRPLLAGDPVGRLAALAAERQPLYEGVATVVIDTDRRSAKRVAADIDEALTALARPTGRA
jgi:shikimate kinase